MGGGGGGVGGGGGGGRGECPQPTLLDLISSTLASPTHSHDDFSFAIPVCGQIIIGR